MKQIGSQRKETLKESGYKFVKRLGPGEIVLSDSEGKQEVWFANNDHAGYTVQVGRRGYEFAHDYHPEKRA